VTDFRAYLEAKRSVDDRALNDRVFEAFVDELSARAASRPGPVRIVEIGGGIGSMLVRLAERDALPTAVRYRLVDLDSETVDYAREWLPARLDGLELSVERTSTGLVARADPNVSPSDSALARNGELRVRLEAGDAFAESSPAEPADAVIGSAVFDLVDLERALPWLSSALRSGGVVYAPLTFDGATGFVPADPLDVRLEALYHRHMDELREEPGSSRAGRRLLGALGADSRGFKILDVGGADWVLRPQDRSEPAAADERLVVRHLLETIDGALADYPASTLDPAERRRWVARRRDDLDSGALTVLAHHLDVLARKRG
jgi:hypothetical protein